MTNIAYPEGGLAQGGGNSPGDDQPHKRSQKRSVRLVVRRTRLAGSQAELWPDWRYHAFVTNLDLGAAEADRCHQPRAGQDTPVTNPAAENKTPNRPNCRRERSVTTLGRRTARRPPVEIDRTIAATPHANSHPRPQRLRGSRPPTVGASSQLTPPADLRRPSPQPLPPYSPPRRYAAARAAGPWTHHPYPTVGLPDASSTTADAPSCVYPPDGPGPAPTKPPSLTSGRCPNSADPARRTPHNHNQPPKPQPHTPETTPTSFQHHLTHQTTPTTPQKPPETDQPQPSTPHQRTPDHPPGRPSVDSG